MSDIVQQVLQKLAVNGEIKWNGKLYRLHQPTGKYKLINPETNDFY